MRRLFSSLAAGLLLSACATPYQSSGMTGGHAEAKGPGNLRMIGFGANGYTSSEVTQQYALYRAAEVAQSLNKPFFIMYDSLTSAALERPSAMPRVGMALGKPQAVAFVLLLDAPRPGVHDTRATLDDLAPLIASGKLDNPTTPRKP